MAWSIPFLGRIGHQYTLKNMLPLTLVEVSLFLSSSGLNVLRLCVCQSKSWMTQNKLQLNESKTEFLVAASLKLFNFFFPSWFSPFFSSVLCICFALSANGMDCSRSGVCMFFFMINKDDILYISILFPYQKFRTDSPWTCWRVNFYFLIIPNSSKDS